MIEENEKKRYEEIFHKLDRNKNGRIDIHDLRDELGVSEKFAQVRKRKRYRLFTFLKSF